MQIVCRFKSTKSDKNHIDLCAGGDQLPYDGPLKTPTTDITTVKLHVNITISTLGARYMTGDMKNFHLGSLLKDFEYINSTVQIFHKNSLI